MGAGVANGRVQFCPFHVIFPMKAECIVCYNSVQMFPVKFSTDIDPKRRNKKALAYLVMALNELMEKITVILMMGDSGLSVSPCPMLYDILL